MPIISERPIKTCRYCNKDVQNLPAHIINQHPSILEQLEEGETKAIIQTPQNLTSMPPNTPLNQINMVSNDIDALVKQKLNTMFNIRIIQMLSNNASLEDISKIVNPQPQQTLGLKELKEFHDIVYNKTETQDSGNQWLDLAVGALPIINRMLPEKQKHMEENKNVEHRTTKDGDIRKLKPISEQITRDTREPANTSDEPRTIIQTEQPNNRELEIINKGN
jgi:hypothetical protein